MCDKVLSKEPIMLKYCLDRCKTQEICNKAFDTVLLILKIVLDCFVTSEMLDKLDNIIFCNDNIAIHDINSILTFFSDGIGLNTIDLNNINLNYDEDDPENVIHVRHKAWCKQRKACKRKSSKN